MIFNTCWKVQTKGGIYGYVLVLLVIHMISAARNLKYIRHERINLSGNALDKTQLMVKLYFPYIFEKF